VLKVMVLAVLTALVHPLDLPSRPLGVEGVVVMTVVPVEPVVRVVVVATVQQVERAQLERVTVGVVAQEHQLIMAAVAAERVRLVERVPQPQLVMAETGSPVA
jgi:hypothetical protein